MRGASCLQHKQHFRAALDKWHQHSEPPVGRAPVFNGRISSSPPPTSNSGPFVTIHQRSRLANVADCAATVSITVWGRVAVMHTLTITSTSAGQRKFAGDALK